MVAGFEAPFDKYTPNVLSQPMDAFILLLLRSSFELTPPLDKSLTHADVEVVGLGSYVYCVSERTYV